MPVGLASPEENEFGQQIPSN